MGHLSGISLYTSVSVGHFYQEQMRETDCRGGWHTGAWHCHMGLWSCCKCFLEWTYNHCKKTGCRWTGTVRHRCVEPRSTCLICKHVCNFLAQGGSQGRAICATPAGGWAWFREDGSNPCHSVTPPSSSSFPHVPAILPPTHHPTG